MYLGAKKQPDGSLAGWAQFSPHEREAQDLFALMQDVRLLNEGGIEHVDGPGGMYYIRDRIIIVPKNGLIPDGTVV